MHNINLYEKLTNPNENSSILDMLNIKELKRDKLNTYYKTFASLKLDKNKVFLNKQVVQGFNDQSSVQKFRHRKIAKKALGKQISRIYQNLYHKKRFLEQDEDYQGSH